MKAQQIEDMYARRFEPAVAYRRRVWNVLVGDFFQRFVPPEAAVLELGCGYGEFINRVRAGTRYGMDLNPASRRFLVPEVQFVGQDCTLPWGLPDHSLDVIFTSNFFEHIADKATLGRIFDQAHRCLRPGGKLIAMGPNVKCVPGAYWDFWDHHIPLSEASLAEGLHAHGFAIELCRERFLPYTMVNGREYPDFFLRVYLRCPWVWRFFGKQFLVVASAC